MATTNLKSERWQYTEATVGDIFQGDLASSTTHGLILKPNKCSCSAHAYNHG